MSISRRMSAAAVRCSGSAAVFRCSAGASPIPPASRGRRGAAEGLGLLDLETVLSGDKQLHEVRGREIASGAVIHGYEMHVGRTTGPALARPMLDLEGRPEGAVSADGRIMGCYVHGLFAADDFRHAFLARLKARTQSGLAFEQQIEATLDALADHLEAHVDLEGLLAVARAR